MNRITIKSEYGRVLLEGIEDRLSKMVTDAHRYAMEDLK